MSTIVVLGGGIGGLSTAFELKDELGGAHEIVLVSDQEHFEFTPSNPVGRCQVAQTGSHPAGPEPIDAKTRNPLCL